MEKVLEEFILLINKALEVAMKKQQDLKDSNANIEVQDFMSLIIKNLAKIKDNTLSGKLRRPSDGASLGLSYHIGEWFQGEELNDLARQIDRYYKEKM
ncbi:MAG: hypothetical protein ABH841_01055 [Candidatus Nealsonbacteria bacterium]